MNAFRISVAIVAFLVCAPLAADAQTVEAWPSRPVRVIVPFPAAGSTDIAARLVGEHLSRSLKQQFFVDNRSVGKSLALAAAVLLPLAFAFLARAAHQRGRFEGTN